MDAEKVALLSNFYLWLRDYGAIHDATDSETDALLDEQDECGIEPTPLQEAQAMAGMFLKELTESRPLLGCKPGRLAPLAQWRHINQN